MRKLPVTRVGATGRAVVGSHGVEVVVRMSAARRTMSGCRQTSHGRGVMREYCGVFISCLAFIVVPISRRIDV